MTESIARCTVDDFQELTAFLARAFAKPCPQWFQTSLPAVYRPLDELMRCNYVVRQKGRIVACVGAFPLQWQLGDARLNLRGLGGVCTDPDCRRQGLMKLLMNRVLADLRAEGWPLAWLSGQRQRYRYWGFERCGLRIVGHLTSANLKHEPAWQNLPAVTVEPMLDHPDVLTQAKSFWDARPQRCLRPLDRFWHHMVQWGARPVIARDAAGHVLAYAVLRHGQPHVEELAARDLSSGLALLRALVEQHSALGVTLDQFPPDLARTVGHTAESLHAEPCGNWQIFDWCATLQALLQARHACSPLFPGHVALGVQSRCGEPDQVVRVEVDDTGPHCQRTPQAPDLETDSATMTRLLLGPLQPSAVMPLPRSAAILDQWCPLPATLSRQDEV